MGRSPCCEKAHTNKGAWTQQEDTRLVAHIRVHGEGGWRSLPKAAGLLRCGKSCRLRWINYLRPDLKRGNFSEEEDELIIRLHSLLGNKWSLIAGRLPGRTDNEIKNHWSTHIKRKLSSKGFDPHLKRGNFSEEEDELIIRLHSLLGNKWSLIAGRLPGRSGNEIKNHWSIHMKRKLSRRGLHPQTHRSLRPPHNSTTALNSPPGPDHQILAFESRRRAEIADFFQLEGLKCSPIESAASTDEEHPCPDINLDLCMGLPSNSAPA
eukprot:PITA_34969